MAGYRVLSMKSRHNVAAVKNVRHIIRSCMQWTPLTASHCCGLAPVDGSDI